VIPSRKTEHLNKTIITKVIRRNDVITSQIKLCKYDFIKHIFSLFIKILYKHNLGMMIVIITYC